MDCVKVGKLILALRKEKGITQKQLADTMNISDKTISKWERGMGGPDISLLSELSKVLNVDIGKILQGDLELNNADGGNMNKVKFYVCPNCGDTLTATGEADVSCCGRKLNPITAKLVDEVHGFSAEEVENDYYVTFSHEMSKEHYLGFVAYVSNDRMLFIKLYPEQNSEVRFPKEYGGKLYFYCTLHGLWAKRL